MCVVISQLHWCKLVACWYRNILIGFSSGLNKHRNDPSSGAGKCFSFSFNHTSLSHHFIGISVNWLNSPHSLERGDYLSARLVQVFLTGGGAVVLFIWAVDLLLLRVDVLPQPVTAHTTHSTETEVKHGTRSRIQLHFRGDVWMCERWAGQGCRGVWVQTNTPWMNKDERFVQEGDFMINSTHLVLTHWKPVSQDKREAHVEVLYNGRLWLHRDNIWALNPRREVKHRQDWSMTEFRTVLLD